MNPTAILAWPGWPRSAHQGPGLLPIHDKSTGCPENPMLKSPPGAALALLQPFLPISPSLVLIILSFFAGRGYRKSPYSEIILSIEKYVYRLKKIGKKAIGEITYNRLGKNA
jgi:hypothetical protein